MIRRKLDGLRPGFVATCDLSGEEQIRREDAILYTIRREVYKYPAQLVRAQKALDTKRAKYEATHAPIDVVKTWCVKFDALQ
jgi:hypothetical protein